MPAERHDLVNLLADYYPDAASSRRLVVDAGLDPKLIGVHAIPTDTWFSIVENADRNEKLDDLLDLACDEYPALRAKLPARRRPARLEISTTHGGRGSLPIVPPVEEVPAPLLARILDVMRPEQVWLFGSRARGGARLNSDWDLLVVLPDNATEDELDAMLAWQRVRDLRIPADVIPVRRGEFEEARDHAGTLVRTVVGEGRLVYAR